MILAATYLVASGSFFGYEFVAFLVSKHFDIITLTGIGSLVGILISAWLFFITSLWIPLSFEHAIFHALLLNGISFLVGYKRPKRSKKLYMPILHYLIAVFVPFILLSILFQYSFLYKGVYTRGACYGDLPFHLNIISSFAWGCNSQRKFLFDVVSPFYANEPLAYPFIPNFYSAVLVKCFGASYHTAVLLPSIVAAYALFAVLSCLVYQFSRSKAACCVAPWLFLLTGGLGFTRWFNPKFRNEFNIDYVHNWGGDRYEGWFQTVNHILLPQRASLFSLPIAHAIILCLMTFGSSTIYETFGFSCIGILVAILPQVQPHSIVATAQWGFVYALIHFPWFNLKISVPFISNYLVLAGFAVAVGFPQIIPFVNRAQNFIKFAPIWTGDAVKKNGLQYWINALGSFFVLSIIIVPFHLYMTSKSQFKVYFPSLVVFALANFIWYQPWHLDNTKVFNAAWIPLAVAGLANFLVYLWKKLKYIGLVMSIVLFSVTIASGALAIHQVLEYAFPIWSENDAAYQVGHFVIHNTDPRSIFITDTWHCHPVVTVGGRQTLLGYRGWVSSHGLPESDRMRVMTNLRNSPENTRDLDNYHVDYICTRKRDKTELVFNPPPNSKKWKLIYNQFGYEIYKRNRN